jgi:preprotein translocase subunit SecD
MNRRTCFLAVAILLGSQAAAWSAYEEPASPKKIPDGVYAVLRDSDREQDIMPLKEGETLLANRHRYLKNAEKEPPRYLAVHSSPDVVLDLAGEPKADKDGQEVVRIQLKLRPAAAAALEKLTRERPGKQLAIVLDGEVVTVHKIRTVITGGDVQITSCSPGGAKYLLKRLEARQGNK